MILSECEKFLYFRLGFKKCVRLLQLTKVKHKAVERGKELAKMMLAGEK